MANPGHDEGAIATARTSAPAGSSIERNTAWVQLTARRIFAEHTQLLARGAGAVVDGTSAVVERTGALVERTGALVERTSALVNQTSERVQDMLSGALDLVGIRYRRGGSSAETGFDCSGFVGFVFRENMGLALPRTSYEISRIGQKIAKNELEPGDLVFFKTMRHAFSHVGIYLGDNKFVHAPSAGEKVRVEDMTLPYWTRRFDGARRIEPAAS